MITHKGYCCSQGENPEEQVFDKYGYCVDCGITSSSIEPVMSVSKSKDRKIKRFQKMLL